MIAVLSLLYPSSDLLLLLLFLLLLLLLLLLPLLEIISGRGGKGNRNIFFSFPPCIVFLPLPGSVC